MLSYSNQLLLTIKKHERCPTSNVTGGGRTSLHHSFILYSNIPSSSLHFTFKTTWLNSPPLHHYFCPHPANLIFPLPLLEQFHLNAEPQLSQSGSRCRPSIRSRPFAFSSLDKEKKRNFPSSFAESCQWLPGLYHHTSSNGQWDGGKEPRRLRSDRRSWDQGPDGGQHSHSLHADDSQRGHQPVGFPSAAQTGRDETKRTTPPAMFKKRLAVWVKTHLQLQHLQHLVHKTPIHLTRCLSHTDTRTHWVESPHWFVHPGWLYPEPWNKGNRNNHDQYIEESLPQCTGETDWLTCLILSVLLQCQCCLFLLTSLFYFCYASQYF